MKLDLVIRQLSLTTLALAALLLAVPAIHAQTMLYITNGDASSLQAIDVTTGQIVFSATTHSLGYPIAVRDTSIWVGHRDNTGFARPYNPSNGFTLDAVAALSGVNYGNFVDGAVNGNTNYTLVAFTNSSTIYSTNMDWTNPVSLFTVTGTDFVGITFDTASGNLWISDQSSISQYTLSGTLVSQFTHSSGRVALAYQASTDSLWLVPNNSSDPLLQYSKSGTLLQALTVTGRSGNVFGAEFQSIPEPSTYALLTLGLGAVLWRQRRRGSCAVKSLV